MSKSPGMWRTVAMLAVGGGLAFWLANLAISLTPLAAQYREALSIQYFPMLLQALVGGLTIGFCIGYCLLRFFDRIPSTSAMAKSLLLSGTVLVVVTVIIEMPAKFGTDTSDAWRYFLIATLFNALRILALGVTIGALYGRVNTHARA